MSDKQYFNQPRPRFTSPVSDIVLASNMEFNTRTR